MADTHETIADIIAEKRRQADEIERDVSEKMKRNKMISDRYARELIADIRREADRLEAAHRRERGDAAKLREALEALLNLAYEVEDMNSDSGPRTSMPTKFVIDTAKSALSAPPRNCDVGTAQEQDERFHRFCVKHHTGSCAGCHNPVGDYTVANGVRECALVWAQMPYEEGGAK
ncbi:MAG: hypothetical protein IIZ06_09500 [Kiritimatiellae bacterium]|nr:hypothetical protein [Kiritimatiellia bacterium]